MRDTLDQYYDVLVHRDLDQALALWLSTPIFLGARIAHERTFAAFGLQVAAPLVDRGLIEFVLSIPARFMISPQFDKAFLRRALEGRVSEPFRLRPKDLRLVLDMAPDVLLTEATRRVLADVRVRRRLAQWVRFDVVEELIERLRRGYRPSLRVLWPLECLVAFAQWYARAASEYGVD